MAMAGWHGHTPITYGNDDFALIALIAAFRHWKDDRYLEQIKKRCLICKCYTCFNDACSTGQRMRICLHLLA